MSKIVWFSTSGARLDPTKGNTMIAIEEKPGFKVQSGYETEFGVAELSVERTDISFRDVPGNIVRIQVIVRNIGTGASRPTPMTLESAPLGAFVPWRPLARLAVPALDAGESREMSIEVERPRPTPLGDFERVPPKKLLTAVNAPDESENEATPQPGSGIAAAMLNLIGRRQKGRSPAREVTNRKSLAPDLWELVNRGQPHWAGNINVFIGRKSVERHRAEALRIYPGRTNMAMFMVGGFKKSDAYSFELVGANPDWNTTLYEATNHKDLVVNHSDVPIEKRHWVESKGGLMVMFATQPPVECEKGNLEVHVTQRSSGKTAVVEFSLDAMAKGPGCYVV